MAEDYPNTTGHEASFSDIELRWRGRPYSGFRNLSYSHSRSAGRAEGSNSAPVGNTRGSYEGCEGSIEVLRKTYNQMIADAGDGYMEIPFDITSMAQPYQGDPYTDYLVGCTITNEDFEGEKSPDPLYITVEFEGLHLLPNGVKPMRDIPGID